jgi:hypothetical protein
MIVAMSHTRFLWVRVLAWILICCGLAGGLASLIYGILVTVDAGFLAGRVFVGLGVASILGGLFVYTLLIVLLKLEANTHRAHDDLLDIRELLGRYSEQMRAVAENSMLSDGAKSILHRVREREAARQAIQEEIDKKDWEAAYALIDTMAERFGYKQEADRLREEIDLSRQEYVDQRISAALGQVEAACADHKWEQAVQAAQRIMAVFPRHDRVRNLPREIEQHKQDHKKRLMDEWIDACKRNDVDRSIELLKDLDSYLTPNEAAAMEGAARGIFRTKLQNMGVQFSLAVKEHRWNDAIEVGERIVVEFPNSRMAHEVKENLDALRIRAAQAAAAEMVTQKDEQS